MKKIPYSIDAANQPFDITTKQPQLFVCRDFKHLSDVLEEFASKMAFRVGGLGGNQQGDRVQEYATCEYSSGLQVSGSLHRSHHGRQRHRRSICARLARARSRSRTRNLPGHGRDYHKDGFGSPIGNWKQTDTSPEALTDDELTRLASRRPESEARIRERRCRNGKVENDLRRDGKLLLITFSNCRAKYGDRVLFDPEWGNLRHGGGRQHRFGLQRRRR